MKVLIIILFLIAFASACMLIGYKLGEKEQKKIWIYKACEWLSNEMYNTKSGYCDDNPTVDSIHYDTSEDLVEAFRKAMKE